MISLDPEMLTYHRTSLMTSPAQTVVNTVNCVGVMGKGIAAEFKQRFPSMFREYKEICSKGLLEPGKLWLWQGADQWVLNFPTKKHWRGPSKLEWIEMGLQKFVEQYQARGITEIAFPRLGCGNGGLSWMDVKPLMERYLSPLPIPVYIHDYEVNLGLPEHLELLAERLRPLTEQTAWGAYEDFVRTLAKTLDVVGKDLVDFNDEVKFTAASNSDGGITLFFENSQVELEEEAVRGIWMALLNSLVTSGHMHELAGSAAPGIFSILSLMPHVRVVQVQRKHKEEPEPALEINRRRLQSVNHLDPNSQKALAWR